MSPTSPKAPPPTPQNKRKKNKKMVYWVHAAIPHWLIEISIPNSIHRVFLIPSQVPPPNHLPPLPLPHPPPTTILLFLSLDMI